MSANAPARPAALSDLLTVTQAADWIGVTPDTIRVWIVNEKFPNVKNVGSEAAPRYRIPRADVLALFKDVQTVPPPPPPRGAS